MRKSLLVLVSFFLLAGCEHTGVVEVETPTEEDGSEGSTDPSVCYLGQSQNQEECLNPAIFSDLDYIYLNPFSDEINFPAGLDPNQYRVPIQMIALAGVDPELFLAPYFRVDEFMDAFKGPFGMTSPIMVERLSEIRERIAGPLVINSAFRSPGYNSRIGGATWSRHMYGDAVDIWSPGVGLTEIKEQCLVAGASYIEVYSTHVHCDWRNSPLEEAFFGPSSEPRGEEQNLSQVEVVTQSGELLVGSSLELAVEEFSTEDPGEILYSWKLLYPDGSYEETSEKNPNLLLHQSGTYMIEVEVGGFRQGRLIFDIH